MLRHDDTRHFELSSVLHLIKKNIDLGAGALEITLDVALFVTKKAEAFCNSTGHTL